MRRCGGAWAAALVWGVAAIGAAGGAGDAVLIRNVRIFDGRSDRLSPPSRVLVQGNRIAAVAPEGPQSPSAPPGARVVDGGGNVLMPGLIDAHWHAAFCALPQTVLLTADPAFIHIVNARQAEATLMRGFTSVRDMGGPTFGLKMAIDRGIVRGPRLWPAGAHISQTGGHGDFRLPSDVPRACCSELAGFERMGASVIADGVPEVHRRVREQLMMGASHIKLMAGGGVSSLYDPIDVAQYTVEEMRAAVQDAENWGTYVTVHAYTPRAIQAAIEAGVRCIEHGQLADEATVRRMAEKGVWWCLQPFLIDEFANVTEGERRRKQEEVATGTDRAYRLAKQYGVKVAWGTDILFSAEHAARQGAHLQRLLRWYTPPEILRMATSVNAELLQLSGRRNPYPGKLGVVEEDALADLLVVRGNPLDDISLLAEPERNLLLIMKDGRIEKTLDLAVEPAIERR